MLNEATTRPDSIQHSTLNIHHSTFVFDSPPTTHTVPLVTQPLLPALSPYNIPRRPHEAHDVLRSDCNGDVDYRHLLAHRRGLVHGCVAAAGRGVEGGRLVVRWPVR